MNNNQLKEYWDTCNVGYAHLTPDRNLLDPGNLVYLNKLKKMFINYINWKDKIILDYGVGGGYLGKYLFDVCGIKKYIGIDVSQRSLDFTNMTLKNYKIRLYLAPKDFTDFDIDIFICCAVMQHFPDEEYLLNFLNMINNSKIKKACFIFKYSDPAIFKNTYEPGSTNAGTLINKNYLMKKLTNFKLCDVPGNKLNVVAICDNMVNG